MWGQRNLIDLTTDAVVVVTLPWLHPADRQRFARYIILEDPTHWQMNSSDYERLHKAVCPAAAGKEWLFTFVYIYTDIYIYIYISIHMYLYTCMHIYMYMYTYTYT